MLSGGDAARQGTGRGAPIAAAATLVAALAASSSAAAGESITDCAEAGAAFATVQAAGARDGATIRLADGAEVRLAGVIAANSLDGDAEAVDRATAALHALVAGRRLSLFGKVDARDRYGRLTAQVALEHDPARWVQAELVRAGMLRAAPGLSEPACADALLLAERAARVTGAGLWSAPRFAVQEASDLAALLAAAGRYAVVEGMVRRIGESGGRLFLDFGERYRRDFTVVIPPRAQKSFAAAGIDLRGLAGQRVRVRGVLYSWGGPAVEIQTPAELELFGAGGA